MPQKAARANPGWRRSFQLEAAAPVFLALVLTAVFAPVLFGGRMFFDRDVALQYYPWAVFLGKQLRQAQLPLWVSELGCGFPLPAASEAATFYPLNWLMFGLLPLERGFTLHIVLHIGLLGWGTYAYLKAIGLSRQSALLGAFTMMLGGWSTGRVLHPSLLRSSAWLPIGFWCLQKGNSGSTAWTAAAGVCVGLSWLAGHPQIASYVSIAIIAHAVWLGIQAHPREKRRRRLLRGAAQGVVVAAIGTVAGAAQWLPTLLHAGLSARASRWPFEMAAAFSFHPRNLITFIFPGFFGFQLPGSHDFWGHGNFWELCVYIGIWPLLMAVVSWQARHKPITRFFLGLAAVSFSIMVGRYTGELWLLSWFPLFNRFKNPERWSVLLVFSLAVLAGIGADALRQQRQARVWLWRVYRWLAACVLAAVIFCQALCFALSPVGQDRLDQLHACAVQRGWAKSSVTRYHEKTAHLASVVGESVNFGNRAFTGALLLLLAAGVIAWRLARSEKRAGPLLLLGLAVAVLDLSFFSIRCQSTRPIAEATRLPHWLLELGGGSKEGRLITDGPEEDDSLIARQVFTLMPAAYGVDSANPSGPLALDRQARLYRKALEHDADGNWKGAGAANVLNVRYLISPDALSHPQLRLMRSSPYFLYERKNAWPRVYLARAAQPARDPTAEEAVAGAAAFGEGRGPMLIEQGGDLSPATAGPGNGAGYEMTPVRVLHDEAGGLRRRLEVEAPDAGVLVFGESWYPGWTATVDGMPVPVNRVNGFSQGVRVEAGRHVIKREYRPNLTWFGMGLSCLTPIAAAIGAWSLRQAPA